MISLFDAICALNPNVVTLHGDIALDLENKEVAYDLEAAQAKLSELQAAETAAEQAAAAHKASAISKLTALGLTQAEINALIG